MKLIFKTIPLIVVSLFISLYLNGCSSTEQTTARLAFAQGDYQKAEKEFKVETVQNPQNEEAWFYLALTEVQLRKLNDADKAIKEYRRIGKNTFQSELTDAWGKQYDAGYQNFQNASSYKTDTAFSLKLYRSALENFKAALILLPDSAFVQKNIDVINSKVNSIAIKPILDKGVAMEGTGDYEGAVNEYKKALDLAPKESANYEIVAYDLGVAYLKWGEKIRDANAQSNPDDQSHKEKYKLALPYLEDLTNSTDDQTKLQAWDLLVQVYGNLNMIDKAKEAIQKRDDLKSKKNK